MPPGKLLVLVGDEADVVRILKHAVPLLERDGLLSSFRRWSCGEATIFHGSREPFEGVLARCIQLESKCDEWATLRVDRNGVDEESVDLMTCVQVANASTSNGAPVLSLVSHLDADVFTALAALNLVEDVGDGFHRLGKDAVAEVLPDRDDLDAKRL